MKLTQIIARSIGRVAALALLGSMALVSAAKAANIKMECRVAGYSTAGWIEVRPASNTGGRVQRDGSGYYTDRVSRGEPLRVNFLPTGAEYCYGGALTGAYWDSGSTGIAAAWLPFAMSGRLTTNPGVDNVHVWVYTNMGYFNKRIPIGTR